MTQALSPLLLISTAGSIEGEPSAAHPDEREREASQGTATWRFVSRAGYRSHLNQLTLLSTWPLQGVPDLPSLAAVARDKRILYERPEEGDLFLKHDERGPGFARTGIVTNVLLVSLPAVRDVTSTVLALDGVRYLDRVAKQGAFVEQLSSGRGDRFIRWVELDERIWNSLPTVLPARVRNQAA